MLKRSEIPFATAFPKSDDAKDNGRQKAPTSRPIVDIVHWHLTQAVRQCRSIGSGFDRDSNSEFGASARSKIALDALLPSLDVSCIPPMRPKHSWPE
jgi:hypothetical protein